MNRAEIFNSLCYTELVYGRINKKLKINLSNEEIEKLMCQTVNEAREQDFQKIGKNYYISNNELNIRVTVNSFTFRVITADRIS